MHLPSAPLPPFFSITIPKREYKKNDKNATETSHEKFSEGKQAHVGMEALKTNQTRWESTTPQHFHTIPTSCAILPTICTPQNSLHALSLFHNALNKQGTQLCSLQSYT